MLLCADECHTPRRIQLDSHSQHSEWLCGGGEALSSLALPLPTCCENVVEHLLICIHVP